MRRKIPVLASLFAFAVLSFGPLSAQSSKGIITGLVRDPSGAVIPGATVTVTDQQTNVSRTTKTDGNGAYRFEGLDPDAYTIHVVMTGFKAIDSKNVAVVPSQTVSQDIALSIGNESQEVTVTADSNTINTENGQLSGTVSQVEIAKLPVFSLSPIQLATTVPGVSPVNQTLGLGSLGGNGFQIQVNGARPRANNFLLDGQDINDIGIGGQAFQPNQLDAYQSVAVLTNSSSAEYGRAGGAVVNTITKTGTNNFHGTVYDLYQGSGLNSIDGQTRVTQNAQKARFDQHTFGGVVGGPIIKDKLFAFGGTQFQRFYGNSQAGSITLPDAAGYAQLVAITGAQSQLLQQYLANGSYLTTYHEGLAGTPINISDRQGCTGGCQITTASFSRPPLPTQNPDTQWITRVDFTPESNDTFFYRYLHDYTFLTPDLGTNTSGLPGFDNTQGGPSELAQGGWTHVFTPTLINELRASELRIGFSFAPLPATVNGPLGKAYNIILSGSGFPELGIDQNLPQGRDEDLYQIQDTVGWTHGRHSFRIGVDLGRQIEKDLVSQNAFGALTFSRGGTPSHAALSSVDNFLNNIIGGSGSATKSFGPTRIDPHVYKMAGFIQDDIKISPELTVNAGLRYDYVSPPENTLPFPSIDQSNPYLPIDTVIKVQPDRNNFGPRAGFAYAPHRGKFLHDTVFHGGFGMFYDTDFSNIAVNSAQSAPNSPTGSIVSTKLQPVDDPATGLIATIQPKLTPFNSVLGVSNHLGNPVTMQYNFGFERQLPLQLKLTMNYVGNHGYDLYANQQYNYFDPTTGERINPNRGAINARINDGVSNYNGLETEVSHQFTHGLFVTANYVYSKTLDDSSEVFATFASPTSYDSNLAPGHRMADYGNSVFDHRHFFSIAYVYAPVGFHASNGFSNGLLSAFTRNFTFSGVTQLQSGSYSSWGISGLDTNGDGSAANDRAILSNAKAPLDAVGIDGIYFGATPGVYYDMAQLNNNVVAPIDPASAHWLIKNGGAEITPQGIGRNSFENPGTTTWNFGVEKDVPVSKISHLEGSAFQFRVEAQNLFNHNDVGLLDNSVLDAGTPTYLNPSTARVSTNRNVRVWMKFAF